MLNYIWYCFLEGQEVKWVAVSHSTFHTLCPVLHI